MPLSNSQGEPESLPPSASRRRSPRTAPARGRSTRPKRSLLPACPISPSRYDSSRGAPMPFRAVGAAKGSTGSGAGYHTLAQVGCGRTALDQRHHLAEEHEVLAGISEGGLRPAALRDVLVEGQPLDLEGVLPRGADLPLGHTFGSRLQDGQAT